MFHIIKKEDYKVSQWSGGTTTEIYLAPVDGSYAERRFDFRISSATVDLEESDFTMLDGVKRYLTILEGGMDLTFNEQTCRQVTLKPYEVVEFMGDVPTHSVGQAKDFNLMLKNCCGKMETYMGDELQVKIPAGADLFIYSVHDWTGCVDGESVDVKGEDTLHVTAESEEGILEAKCKSGQWIVITVNK